MIRLVACDIDGTLLCGGSDRISPAVFEEIERINKLGVLFVPDSGRQYGSMLELFRPVADRLYYIIENGAAVFAPGADGRVLDKTVIERSMAEQLCRDIMALDECEVLISTAGRDYLCPKDPGLKEKLRYFLGDDVGIVSSPCQVPADIIKAAAFCRAGNKAVEAKLAPYWREYMNVSLSGQLWLDFTVTDKGEGLRKLCGKLGVDMQDTAAIGDSYNDIPMLDAVGHPYLMDTAPDDLKARYPVHCRSVEDVLREIK